MAFSLTECIYLLYIRDYIIEQRTWFRAYPENILDALKQYLKLSWDLPRPLTWVHTTYIGSCALVVSGSPKKISLSVDHHSSHKVAIQDATFNRTWHTGFYQFFRGKKIIFNYKFFFLFLCNASSLIILGLYVHKSLSDHFNFIIYQKKIRQIFPIKQKY